MADDEHAFHFAQLKGTALAVDVVDVGLPPTTHPELVPTTKTYVSKSLHDAGLLISPDAERRLRVELVELTDRTERKPLHCTKLTAQVVGASHRVSSERCIVEGSTAPAVNNPVGPSAGLVNDLIIEVTHGQKERSFAIAYASSLADLLAQLDEATP